MRVSILLQITADDGTAGGAEEVAMFEKATERAEDVGLSLSDGKVPLAAVQRQVVQAQAEEWAGRHRCCASCGTPRRCNGSYLYRRAMMNGSARNRECFPAHVS